MKKITLFFSLLAMMIVGLQAQAAMWLVGDAFNGWNESGNNVQMVEGNDGIYTYTANLTAGKGFAFFKDSEGWSNQRGPQTNEAAPTGDWEETTGSNSWKVATTGEYKIEYNYETDQAKIALVTQEQFDPAKRKFAVTGDAFGGWNMPPAANQTFTNNDDGTYTLKFEGAKAAGFKLSGVGINDVFDENWSVFNSGVLGKASLAEGNNELSNSFGSGNMTFPVSGNVTLIISDVTESSCKLNITVDQEIVPDKAWFIAGSFTNWADGKLALVGNDDGTFSITVQGVQAGAEFKFINENGGWFGGLSSEADINPDHCTGIALVEGDNFKISSGGGDLTFTIDAENKLTVTGWEEPVVDYLLHYGTASSDWQDVTFVAGEGENEGKLVATATFAENTEFGIKHGDTWYAGLPNAGEGLYWIHDTWCTDIPLSTGDGVKHFIINEAGTYTFVLTVGENGIRMDVEGFPVAPVLGDLNGDGKADVTDVNIIVNMILGKQEKTAAGNLNGDDDVDVTDVNLLVNIILGKSGDTTGEGE